MDFMHKYDLNISFESMYVHISFIRQKSPIFANFKKAAKIQMILIIYLKYQSPTVTHDNIFVYDFGVL